MPKQIKVMMNDDDFLRVQEIEYEQRLVNDYYDNVLFNINTKYPLTETWVYDMIQRCQADGITTQQCVDNIENNYEQVGY